jgi:ABC-type nitrate/sulfonate/bicarbonate transport system substrate-binding protein
MSKTTLSTAQDLLGKVIYVPQSGKVPDLTLQASLTALQIPFESGDTAKEGKVVLNYSLVEASNIVKGMIAGNVGIEIGLIPEPAATNLNAKGFNYQLSLQELYDADSKSYPQAVLMAKESVVKREKELIFNMANAFAENVKFAENNPKKAVETIKGVFETTSLAPNLSASAVKGCNIYWQGASFAEDKVENYIDRIRAINVAFANEVEDEFFLGE